MFSLFIVPFSQIYNRLVSRSYVYIFIIYKDTDVETIFKTKSLNKVTVSVIDYVRLIED